MTTDHEIDEDERLAEAQNAGWAEGETMRAALCWGLDEKDPALLVPWAILTAAQAIFEEVQEIARAMKG